jgi:dipeptidyl aminopeptidase/acylaminoacyl peptidase
MAAPSGWGAKRTVSRFPASSGIQAVVDCFGPTDFLKMGMRSLPRIDGHDAPDSPASELVGGAIQEHPELVARANPINYVSKDAPPFLIVHGDRDPLVPYGQSLILQDALAAQGVSVSLYTVSGGSHGNFKDPKVSELIQEFLERCLKAR